MPNKTYEDLSVEEAKLTTCDFCGAAFDENKTAYWTREFEVPLREIVPLGVPIPASDAGITLIPCTSCHTILQKRRERVLVDAYLSKEFKESSIVQKPVD